MPANYLLPCSCGEKIAVDSSQAGLNVLCSCGTKLAVPTMRGLSALERIEAAPKGSAAQRPSAWGPRQGLIFLGATILTFAALAAGFFWWATPSAPSLYAGYQEYNREFIDQKTPEELLEVWHECRTGIEQPAYEAGLDTYDMIVRDRMQWETLAGGVAVVGVALIVIGLMISAKPPV